MENIPDSGPSPRLRPPDFLLPSAESAAVRGRTGAPDIYVSWGGQVYGPTGAEEIIAGVRAASFETDAVYWHQGLPEWRPVAAFPEEFARGETSAPAAAASETPPATDRATKAPNTDRRRHRKPRTAKKTKNQRFGSTGRAVILGFILLAVLLTVGILLLLMLI
jgi:hypothetical protein